MKKFKLYKNSGLITLKLSASESFHSLKRMMFTFSSAILLLISGFFIPRTLVAQQQGEPKTEKISTALAPVDLTASFMSMFKGLALCILILLAVIWLLKKFKSPIVTGQGRKLKILERLPVTARSSLLLVEINQKQLLVGVGADPISLVSDFVQADSIEELQLNLSPAVDSGEKL